VTLLANNVIHTVEERERDPIDVAMISQRETDCTPDDEEEQIVLSTGTHDRSYFCTHSGGSPFFPETHHVAHLDLNNEKKL